MPAADLLAQDAIAEALFGKTRRRVLALLFGRPDESFYLREIVRESAAGTGSVQRELAQLHRAGLVRRREKGQHVYYSADPASPVYDELRSLASKTLGLAGALKRSLARYVDDGLIEHAFIYGSIATGRHSSRSDVDLLIVGDVTLAALVPALNALETQTGRAVNPTVYSRREYLGSYRKRGHFVRRVNDGPKIMLIGSELDLAELAGKQVARRPPDEP
jgi:hypothetical protein